MSILANGDTAAGAGMDVVAATDDARLGYDEINKTRDYIIIHKVTALPWGSITSKPAKVSNYPGITISDNAPSGGADGDIWLEY